MTTKPSDELGYILWAKENLNDDYNDERIRRVYESNILSAKAQVENSSFIVGLSDMLNSSDKDYFAIHNSHLLMSDNTVINLCNKKYSSALNKTYRLNVIWNRDFPRVPKQKSWITFDKWFTELDDIIRGSIVCKYIDGPIFLADKLKKYSEEKGLDSRLSTVQQDVGYYAHHFYVKIPIEISDINWDIIRIDLQVEIQITTQLQEVLYNITHQYYSETRDQINTDRNSWKWEFGSNKFKSGYVSHTLHLLEAIILQLRDDVNRPAEKADGEA